MKKNTKQIDGYSNYTIDIHGNILSIRRLKCINGIYFTDNNIIKMNSHCNGKGYRYITLMSDKKRKNHYIHRLVAKAFIDNPLEKHEVNHIDGDKTNNHVYNLEWVTHIENEHHAYRIGLKSGKRIVKIDNHGTRTKYSSGKEASIENGICTKCVTDAALGRQKTAGGFKWEYV